MSSIEFNDNALGFIADWRSRIDRQQKRFIAVFIGAFILVTIITVVVFSWYQNKNYQMIVQNNMNYIQDSAIQETNQIEHEMERARNVVTALADQYSTLLRVNPNASIQDNLDILNEKSLFDRIAFVDTEGNDISLEGETNVYDRKYFKAALNGETGWESIEISRITGRPTVVFYAPVYKNNNIEGDNEVIGVVLGFYEQQRLDDMFSYQFFNHSPVSCLLLKDGTIIARSDDKDLFGNALSELSQKEYAGDVDYDDIQEVLKDNSRVTLAFSFYEGKKTSVGTIVQFNNLDWMVYSVLPSDTTSAMVRETNNLGRVVLYTLIFFFILLLVLTSALYSRQKKMIEKELQLAIENLEVSINDERRQLAIIQALADINSGVYYIDMDSMTYKRIYENEHSAYQLGDSGDIVNGFGSYIDNFVVDDDRELMHKFLDVTTFNQRLKVENSTSAEYLRIDGHWRRGTIIAATRDEAGKILTALFAVQPIDTEKEAELQTKKALKEAYDAAQMANNAKSVFLSNMSHDIRTPLNAIIGMTAIAGANITNPEKVSDCLKKITSSGKHLLALINEVLDMSKIESGRVDLVEDAFTMSDLFDELIAINQPLLNEKNHTLTVKVKDVKHENVIGDRTRLQQVFTNLLSNAIKYTPDNGRIEIIISEKTTNKDTIGWYEVVFKDNGIGMSEEFCKNLFEPFSRANDKRIDNIQGTGLGMPIARNIIRMMNGDITVSSEINKGSTFTVSFTLRIQNENDASYESLIDLPILVVDDDIIACESTCLILDSLEMKSEYVTSGREAVEKTVQRHKDNDDYYAVIIDWKMPEMNGIETTREIRRQVGKDVPIIIISTYDWSAIEDEAIQAGANAFLSKPLFKSRVAGLFTRLVTGEESTVEDDSLGVHTKRHDFSGKRVLLCEDNEINREITVEMLSMLGLEIECAENGRVGVDMMAASSRGYYDLIFMDIQMPILNGYDATKQIRELDHPDAKSIPIVAMTANAFSTDVRNAFDAGMNGHLAKPLDIKQIIKSLYENLGE